MTTDLDPALIALADQHMTALGADLDLCIQAYLTHKGSADSTVAFVVLADNVRESMTFDQVCDAFALAVHRLAEETNR